MVRQSLHLCTVAAGHFACSPCRPCLCLCLCRSCDAGLQAGAAKCQTLTLFASRRAAENFIQTHVRAATTQHHMYIVCRCGGQSLDRCCLLLHYFHG